MAELRRKDQEAFGSDDRQLKTADLARRGEKPPDPEHKMQPQSVSASGAPPTVEGERSEGSPASKHTESLLATTTGPVDFDSPAVPADGQPAPLFSESEVGGFRSRWSDIQLAFVDEPRQAVEDADNLVASVMKKLAEGFANERAGLERQWDRGDNVSTEDLRVALQRYRSFFDRLLKV
jgi:hypothetical protein